MVFIKRTIAAVIGIAALAGSQANSATWQASAGLETSRFFDGLNLSDDRPVALFSVDASLDNGLFTGADCFAGDVDQLAGIKNGCSLYAGFFKPLNDSQALTLLATRHELARARNREWSFYELEASWNFNQQTAVSVTYARDWFNRPLSVDTVSLEGVYGRDLSDRFSFELIGGITAFENPAPINNIAFARAGLQYNHNRWLVEASIIYTDDRLATMVPFDLDQAELSLKVLYRLY